MFLATNLISIFIIHCQLECRSTHLSLQAIKCTLKSIIQSKICITSCCIHVSISYPIYKHTCLLNKNIVDRRNIYSEWQLNRIKYITFYLTIHSCCIVEFNFYIVVLVKCQVSRPVVVQINFDSSNLTIFISRSDFRSTVRFIEFNHRTNLGCYILITTISISSYLIYLHICILNEFLPVSQFFRTHTIKERLHCSREIIVGCNCIDDMILSIQNNTVRNTSFKTNINDFLYRLSNSLRSVSRILFQYFIIEINRECRNSSLIIVFCYFECVTFDFNTPVLFVEFIYNNLTLVNRCRIIKSESVCGTLCNCYKSCFCTSIFVIFQFLII